MFYWIVGIGFKIGHKGKIKAKKKRTLLPSVSAPDMEVVKGLVVTVT